MDTQTNQAPPKTVGEALDELAALGFHDEVAACRQRMFSAQTQFLSALLGRDLAKQNTGD